MYGIYLKRFWLVMIVGILTLGTVRANVDIVFIPSSAADEYDAKLYQTIWEEYGERIINALETRTCMTFPESSLSATVADATSNSGGPETPMRLRRNYIGKEKESTLVHEIGHRHLWQLKRRLDDIDGHMTLYLFLDRVWADVWGEQFAEDRIRGESGWHSRYAEAWAWSRSLRPSERARLWSQLLVMNDFPSACKDFLGTVQ